MRRASAEAYKLVGNLRSVESSPESEPKKAAESESAAETKASEPLPGVSAFVARVLEQLSLSAWLPGAFLAVSLTVLVQLRSLGESASTSAFLDAIAANWQSILLSAIPVLILAVLIIQASSFAAIQFLEGYGGARGPGRWVRSAMIYWQVRSANALHSRRMRAQARAFDKAEPRWDEPTEVVAALWADSRGRQLTELRPEHRARFDELDWRDECHPWDLARIEEMVEQEKDFPALSRTLPTRLGNVLRSTEDELQDDGSEVTDFVFHRRELAPARIRLQHDQFRTRLDMYSTLVLVSGALAPVSFGLLWDHVKLSVTATAAIGFFVFAVVSYRAAISSARGYCRILKVMNEIERPSSSHPGRT